MAWRRASFASLAVLRSSAVMVRFAAGSVVSVVLDSSVHWGQRLAKPGLSGFSSNSSLQMTQVRMGKGIFDSAVILTAGGFALQIRAVFWEGVFVVFAGVFAKNGAQDVVFRW